MLCKKDPLPPGDDVIYVHKFTAINVTFIIQMVYLKFSLSLMGATKYHEKQRFFFCLFNSLRRCISIVDFSEKTHSAIYRQFLWSRYCLSWIYHGSLTFLKIKVLCLSQITLYKVFQGWNKYRNGNKHSHDVSGFEGLFS